MTLAVPLSTQEYKRVPTNYWENLTEGCQGVIHIGLVSHSGVGEGRGPAILLAISCYRNCDVPEIIHTPPPPRRALGFEPLPPLEMPV